jgi:hypothetical protein
MVDLVEEAVVMVETSPNQILAVLETLQVHLQVKVIMVVLVKWKPSNRSAGGGGGASAVGANGSTNGTAGGNGGAGTASSITGSSVTYAGGGGGIINNQVLWN